MSSFVGLLQYLYDSSSLGILAMGLEVWGRGIEGEDERRRKKKGERAREMIFFFSFFFGGSEKVQLWISVYNYNMLLIMM